MTLCAAALCNQEKSGGTKIVAICDRMISVKEVFQSEIPQTKMWRLSESVLFFISGDIDAQAEVWSRFLFTGPHDQMSIAQITDLYAKECAGLHRRRFESQISKWTIEGLSGMSAQSPEVLDWLTRKIDDGFQPPELQTLIVGLDNVDIGAHIYAVDDCTVSCRDKDGCAAIGSGADYATAQFMRAGHTPFAPMSRTILLTYLAKKRAEVDPFVGRDTYMFLIDPQLKEVSRRLTQREIDEILEPAYKDLLDYEKSLLDNF